MSEMDTPSKEPTPWLPDEQLVDAVLADVKRDIRTLSDLDRCWVVAGLSARGMVVDEIASRLSCTPRMIKSIRARAETRAFTYVLNETRNFRNQLALSDSALRNAQSLLATKVVELNRTREKLNRLIDVQLVGGESCRKCGEPWDKVNTYYEHCPSTVAAGKSPKRRCRNCNRLKQIEFRAKQRRDRQQSKNPQVDDRREYAGFDMAADLGFFDTA